MVKTILYKLILGSSLKNVSLKAHNEEVTVLSWGAATKETPHVFNTLAKIILK